jgi:hypothetical protein
MYVHIALFKWKPGYLSNEVEEALHEIEALVSEIPGIVEIAVGTNDSRHNSGYTHTLLVRAKSPRALGAYRQHPTHARAAGIIQTAGDHVIGVDFVTAGAAKNT